MKFSQQLLSAGADESCRVATGFGRGFGGFGIGQWTITGRLLDHQHLFVDTAIGWNVLIYVALIGRSNATHPQLLGCLWASVQVAINAWDGARVLVKCLVVGLIGSGDK